MNQRIGALVIHGMGSQRDGFSAALEREVSGRLGPAAARVEWQEVFWAPTLAGREAELWTWMRRARHPDGSALPLDAESIREFVVHNFGDALAYHRDPGADVYGDVHRLIDARLRDLKARLGDPLAPIIVLAHSLGGHMASNYIWDTQRANPGARDTFEPIDALAGIITFGCNIPLFSLSYATAKPVTLPGPAIANPRVIAAVRWLNFFDRDDVLGWPLKPLYAKNRWALNEAQLRTADAIDDYELNAGGLFTSWNIASHSRYWTDDDFTVPVARYVTSLLDALDQ